MAPRAALRERNQVRQGKPQRTRVSLISWHSNSDELHAVLLRQRAMDGWIEARVIRVRRTRCRLLQAEPLPELTLHPTSHEHLQLVTCPPPRYATTRDY